MAKASPARFVDPFGKLFGSLTRVRIMRLFLLNPNRSYSAEETAVHVRAPLDEARRELTILVDARLVRRTSSKKHLRFVVNNAFPYLAHLQEMLLNGPLRGSDVYDRVRGAGAIRLIVLTGVFAGEFDARLDVLIVADRINLRRLATAMRELDADLGKELRYTFLPTNEFTYRVTVSDRFVRDIFDYPHRIVFDKLGIGLT